MKRSITRWTTALATAGALCLPVSSFARTTQDPQPQPQQQQPPAQPQPQPTQPEPQPAPATPQPQQPSPQQPSAAPAQPQAEQALTPQDHLKKAQEAANDINATAIPAKNRSSLADMKKHLSNLDKASASNAASTPAEPAGKGSDAAKSAPSWGTEVAAIDKIISEMVGSESSTPATPTPTGTSGSTSATTIDDATRAKLMEVRAQLTAYAAGMAGASTPKTEAAATPAAAASTATAEPPAAAAPAPSSSPAPSPSPAESPAPAQSPAPAPQQNPAPQPDPNAGAPTQQPPATQPPATAAAQAQPQVDTDAAHRHLLAARETLAQLTQLPAATQLNGEARNQVSQLITNFNELITTQANWKASYDKVSANLATLLGADSSDAAAAAAAPAATAGATPAPGAVGTSGTATIELDPAIRAKLVDLRKSLNDFKKAAGEQK